MSTFGFGAGGSDGNASADVDVDGEERAGVEDGRERGDARAAVVIRGVGAGAVVVAQGVFVEGFARILPLLLLRGGKRSAFEFTTFIAGLRPEFRNPASELRLPATPRDDCAVEDFSFSTRFPPVPPSEVVSGDVPLGPGRAG